MQGKRTHEQQLRILERKPDVPDERELDRAIGRNAREAPEEKSRKTEALAGQKR